MNWSRRKWKYNKLQPKHTKVKFKLSVRTHGQNVILGIQGNSGVHLIHSIYQNGQ